MGFGGGLSLVVDTDDPADILKRGILKKEPMFQAPQFYNDVLSSPLSPRGKLMLDYALSLGDLLLLHCHLLLLRLDNYD